MRRMWPSDIVIMKIVKPNEKRDIPIIRLMSSEITEKESIESEDAITKYENKITINDR